MKLENLFQPLKDLSDEELMARLQEIRQRRTVERPAAKARAKKADKVGRITKINKAQGLLAGLTKDEMIALVAKLQKDL